MIVLASIFVGLCVVMGGLLYLYWLCYWWCVRRSRKVVELLHRPGLRPEELQSLYAQQDRYYYGEEKWYARYHWSLFLAPIFFSLAVFCTVFVLTEGLHPWIHVPLTAVSAAGTLLGCGYLMYAVVREKVLPMEWVRYKKE